MRKIIIFIHTIFCWIGDIMIFISKKFTWLNWNKKKETVPAFIPIDLPTSYIHPNNPGEAVTQIIEHIRQPKIVGIKKKVGDWHKNKKFKNWHKNKSFCKAW